MTRTARQGFTLFELVVVLALLIILAATLAPSMSGLYGNSRQKAAADTVRARLADARAKAIETGTPYVVYLSQDGGKVRVAPEGAEYASMPPDDPPAYHSKVTEDTFEGEATAAVVNPDGSRPDGSGGWVPVATFLPEGPCREAANVTIAVRERDFVPIRIQVRGVTGNTRVLPAPKPGGQP